MPVVAQRQNSAVFATAATNIQLNRALYSAVVPAFGLVLLVLALRKGLTSGNHSRSAYAFIPSLAVLSCLTGSLGSHAQAESIIQALLSLFLCIPVLHLTSVHTTKTRNLSRRQFIIRTLLKVLLFISLSSATLLAILTRFLPYNLPAAVHLLFPATFFLAYTVVALCLLLFQIFLEFCQADPGTLCGSSPRPITINIHVTRQSAAVPINLARSSCFSATEPREQEQQDPDNFSTGLAKQKPQNRPSIDSGISIISTFKPTNFVGSVHPSRSNSRRRTDSFAFNTPTVLRLRTRTQSLLPLLSLLLAQFALCASYSCKLVIDYRPISAHELGIIHTSLNVVSVMATMKAYLLHACNTHLGTLGLSMPNSRSSSGYSNNTTPTDVTDKQTTPLGHIVAPPIPPKSLASRSSRFPGHRLRVQPSLDPEACRPHSTISDHDRSTLPDSDETGRDTENGRLVNSFSVGSLKSAYGTSGSEESDQTRVEGSVESDTNKYVGRHVEDLKRTHAHVSMCQRVESPEAYTNKRGIIPAPAGTSVSKKMHGFRWLQGMANRYRESWGEGVFINMGEGRYGVKSSIPSSSLSLLPTGTTPMASARGRDPKKLKRNTTIPTSFAPTTLARTSHPPSAFAYWNSDSTLCRFSPSDVETDMIMPMGNIAPATPVRSSTRKLMKRRSYEDVSPKYGIHETQGKSTCERDEENRNGNAANDRISSPGSLRLKRSFKLDDGRTLSPRLTLAAVIAGETCIPPLVEGVVRFGGRCEREVEGGQELIQLDQMANPNGRLRKEIPLEGEGVRCSQVKGTSKLINVGIKTEGDGNLEGKNAPAAPSEWRLYPGPEKSKEKPWMNIKNSHSIAQCPLEVSVDSVLIPAASEPIKESIQTTNTPSFATGTTAVTYPPTSSEPASCSSSATASPLMPDRTPIIFRLSSSDQGHGQTSREPFPLSRISSSPSSRTQTVLSRRHNAGTPMTPTRGRSTFSSSSSSSSLRLSAATIESVRNAFSGIWSGKRGGMTGVPQSPVPSTASESINIGSPVASTFGGMAVLKDDSDGDFMDLRDPFASPRAKVRRIPSGCAGVASADLSEESYGELCEDVFTTTGGFRKVNTWRRLPVTPEGHTYSGSGQSESYDTYLLTGTENTTYFSKVGNVPKSKERRKERRARKRIQRGPKNPMAKLPVLDDVDFDVEEALLTQRLLKRLDDDIHGSRVRP